MVDNLRDPEGMILEDLGRSGRWYMMMHDDRRKFRSQTSDNMDRWKAEVGRVREEKGRRKKMRRERVRRKMQVPRNTVVLQCFVAPEARKVRVRGHLGIWEMKICTQLWREARLEVKLFKNTPFSEHFWKFRWWKSARHWGAKHIGALLKFRRWKSARRYGAKHISKSMC